MKHPTSDRHAGLRLKSLTGACLFVLAGSAGAIEVTGSFTGWWDQPDQQNHGMIVSVTQLASGEKTGVLYWANYDEQGDPSWLIAQGDIEGDTINADLYQFEGITFMQAKDPNFDAGEAIGSMQVQFDDCGSGNVDFETISSVVGTGGFRIQRLTDQPGTNCSGGISDDTPPTALPEEFDLQLVSTGVVAGASGKADFESRPGRTDFSVEIEDLPTGSYALNVGGLTRGSINVVDTVNGPEGEIEFRSPPEPGKELLDFDPRGKIIEVLQGSTVVLESLAPDNGDIPGGDQGNPPPFGDSEIEVTLVNAGAFPAGSGEAEFEQDSDRVDFEVEIEDVPVGSYSLAVGGIERGTIEVVDTVNGPEGEVEFRFPAGPGKLPLDFDPRGQLIEVADGSGLVFSVNFPATGGNDDDDDDDGNDDGNDDTTEVEVSLTNASVFPQASGDAKFEVDEDGEREFDVEIEDLPVGGYDLVVGGVQRGTITVEASDDGNEGEIEFGDPADDDELMLDFDPRGELIEIFDGDALIFSVNFPS